MMALLTPVLLPPIFKIQDFSGRFSAVALRSADIFLPIATVVESFSFLESPLDSYSLQVVAPATETPFIALAMGELAPEIAPIVRFYNHSQATCLLSERPLTFSTMMMDLKASMGEMGLKRRKLQSKENVMSYLTGKSKLSNM